MKIIDGIKYASELLNMSEVTGALVSGAQLEGSAATELGDLLSCAHGVVREICGEHTFVLHTQTVLAVNGHIAFSAFSYGAIEILQVTRADQEVRFATRYGGIGVADDGEYAVTYAYLPIIASLADTVEFANPKIDERIVGYGIAAEYCMRAGMTDEAVLWDRRYKDALYAASRTRREQRVKPRRWV